jgi:hypothetical protein
MTAVQQTPKKRAPRKKKVSTDEVAADHLNGKTTPEEAVAALHVVKPKPKPGEKDFDWAAEYPGERCWVYTSPAGLTVGLTALGPTRQPKPGKLRRLHHEGGLSVMWHFIELVSSPNSLLVQEELESDEYNNMLRGWAEFAGIELSE